MVLCDPCDTDFVQLISEVQAINFKKSHDCIASIIQTKAKIILKFGFLFFKIRLKYNNNHLVL